jgi:hypothetical protein
VFYYFLSEAAAAAAQRKAIAAVYRARALPTFMEGEMKL